MKIAVNTRLLMPQKLEGIGWFSYEIFKRLTASHPEVEWVFLWDRPFDREFLFEGRARGRYCGPPSRHPVLWYLWFEYSLPYLLRSEKPDLLISPDGYIPLNSPVKTLPVIHDINFHHQKHNINKVAGAYMRYFFSRYAAAATRIATVSQYSRNDIANTYGLSPKKIDLVYNGVSDFFGPLSPAEIKQVRGEITAGAPYFVFVGALNPRKNIDGMLKAFLQYREQGGKAHFVIVGDKMFWHAALNEVFEKHPYRAYIHFTGRLQGQALNRCLGAAQALCFVSHFEGFGIPILEAFKCAVPVITATNSSMPEVAGEAALLCDSHSEEQIAEAMKATEQVALRQKLIARGLEQVKKFSWNRSASMMWQSIEKTLAQ